MIYSILLAVYFITNAACCVSEFGDEDLHNKSFGAQLLWLTIVFFFGVPIMLGQLAVILVEWSKRNP